MRIRDELKEFAIREKALEMIVKNGFDGLSMQKLAKAACVSPATIYIYYENREDLVHKLFSEAQKNFSTFALKNFSPESTLESGLWMQWKNRMRFIKENMCLFVKNAIKRGELTKMEPELFWSIAYGSFYSLFKFHLQEKKMMSESFKITDAKLKQMLKMVLKALKPEKNNR